MNQPSKQTTSTQLATIQPNLEAVSKRLTAAQIPLTQVPIKTAPLGDGRLKPAQQALWDQLVQSVQQSSQQNPSWKVDIVENRTLRLIHENDDFTDLMTPNQAFLEQLNATLINVIQLLSKPHPEELISSISLESHQRPAENGDIENALSVHSILTQHRSRGIYRQLFDLPQLSPHYQWMQGYLIPYGLSSNQPVTDQQGRVKPDQSTRIDIVIKFT